MLSDQQRSFLSHVKTSTMVNTDVLKWVSCTPPPARGPHTVSTGLRLCNGWSVSMANEGLVCGRASEPPTRFSSFPHCTQQTQPSPETQHKLLPCVSSCCLDILDTVTRYCAVRWNNASCGCMETSVELPRRVEVLQATGPNIALITWI